MSSFFIFEYPSENETMSEFIENKLNGFEEVDDWRDEDGCKKKSKGKTSTRITDVCKTENIVFILRRLISIDGNLEIVKARVPLGREILLKDVKGRTGTFAPISVIHHMGEVFNDTTRGHYQADILDKRLNQWVRTSDEEAPGIILESEITDQGYIFLYKRRH